MLSFSGADGYHYVLNVILLGTLNLLLTLDLVELLFFIFTNFSSISFLLLTHLKLACGK